MPARTPDGPPPPPTVQRVRLRYAKRGRLRFSSHRDVARAFERALRVARVPMAYSAGFTPHPKISWVGASPTGVASEAEYVEIGLAQPVDPGRLLVNLDASLPPGLDVVDAVVSGGGSLPDRVQASLWQVLLPGVPPAVALRAVTLFLATGTLPVERLTKDGRRRLDARAPVLGLTVSDGATRPASAEPCAILEIVVRHVTPAVRPDDVLTGLRLVADLAPPVPPLATRLAQGPLGDDGQVGDPLAPDRDPLRTGPGCDGPPGEPPGSAARPSP